MIEAEAHSANCKMYLMFFFLFVKTMFQRVRDDEPPTHLPSSPTKKGSHPHLTTTHTLTAHIVHASSQRHFLVRFLDHHIITHLSSFNSIPC